MKPSACPRCRVLFEADTAFTLEVIHEALLHGRVRSEALLNERYEDVHVDEHEEEGDGEITSE